MGEDALFRWQGLQGHAVGAHLLHRRPERHSGEGKWFRRGDDRTSFWQGIGKRVNHAVVAVLGTMIMMVVLAMASVGLARIDGG
jgi:hypothetical protein